MTEMEIIDKVFLRQFETEVDGHLDTIEYDLQERKIFLTKLVIPEEIDKEGFEEHFIKAVLHRIEEKNLSVMPTHRSIVDFLRKNKRYQKMLPVGIQLRNWYASKESRPKSAVLAAEEEGSSSQGS